MFYSTLNEWERKACLWNLKGLKPCKMSSLISSVFYFFNFFIFKYLFIYCVCMCVCLTLLVQMWRSDDVLQQLVLFFHSVDPGDLTQVSRFGDKYSILVIFCHLDTNLDISEKENLR